MNYFIKSIEEIEPSLPLIKNIDDEQLAIIETKIGKGVAKGINAACEVCEEVFTKLFLDNNNLTDEDLAIILDGTLKLYVARKVVIRRNEFGQQSLQRIEELMTRFFPQNLEELRIEKCKINREVTLGLIKAMNKGCFLRRLALVQVSFDDESITEMKKFIEESRYLEDLDISFNFLQPK